MNLINILNEVNKQMECDLLISNIRKKIETISFNYMAHGITKTLKLNANIKKLKKSNGSYSIGIIIIEDDKYKSEFGNPLATLRLNFIKWLKTFLKKNQYFLEFQEASSTLGIIKTILYIEENHGIKVEKLPRYIFHFTAVENLKSILKNGLIPKTHKKIEPHPKRIYFLLDDDDSFENTLHSYTKTNYNFLAKLKVDTNKIHNQFYLDNDLFNGIYTDEKINPNAITLIYPSEYSLTHKLAI